MDPATSPHFNKSTPAARIGDPSWEIALLFPAQGSWTQQDYLALDTNWMVEFSDGCVEVLPMPTLVHQRIVRCLFQLLQSFITRFDDGEVLFAPLPIRLRPGKFREPDLIYLRPTRARTDGYPDGADLVVEVISEGNEARHRDLTTKRAEYALAGITEYWIVDPEERRILVQTLEGDDYRLHGEFRAGEAATSRLLSGFSASVDEVFAAGDAE